MRRDFKHQLEDATGDSDQIIAIFIDVRGFSALSRNTDSANVATFVRHVYRKTINERSRPVRPRNRDELLEQISELYRIAIQTPKVMNGELEHWSNRSTCVRAAKQNVNVSRVVLSLIPMT